MPPDSAKTDRSAPVPAGPMPSARALRAARLKMLGLFAVFLAPVVAAYVAYYLMPPAARTNYGALVEPQRPMVTVPLDAMPGVAGDVGPGQRFDRWLGRWVLVVAASGSCDDACRERLYAIRQVRLTTGKDRNRVERVWIVLDDVLPAAGLLAEHDGLAIGRMKPAEFAARFPAGAGHAAAEHVFLIDPLGNLMMRFPSPLDPSRMKKDLLRLLKISRIG